MAVFSSYPLTGPVAFPSDQIDPNKKDKEWIGKYGRAILGNFSASARDIFFNARYRYAEQRLYAQGQQSTERYKRKRKPSKQAMPGGGSSEAVIDPRVLQLAPHYINVATGILARSSFAPTVKPIDLFSVTEMDYKKTRMKVMMQQKAFLESIGISQESVPDLQGLPADDNELELVMALEGKPRAALKMEVKLQKDLDGSNFDQLNHEIGSDAVEINAIVYKDCEISSRRHYIERVRPEDFLVGPSKLEDFRDSRYMGAIKTMSLGEIKQLARDELSETDYQNLSQQGSKGNTLYDAQHQDGGGYLDSFFDQLSFDVLHFEFRSENVKVFKASTTRFGNPIIREKGFYYDMPPAEKVDSEVVRDKTTVIYEGYLIIGTVMTFGCQLQKNMRRDPVTNLPMFSYHPFIPKTSCVGQQVMSSVDFIEACRRKMHDHIARSVPKGYAYDLDAIDNIVLKKGEAKLSPGDIIAFHRATGHYLYRSRGLFNKDNERSNSAGITEQENSMSPDVERLANLIRGEIELLERITNLSGQVAANDPRPEVGKATTEIAIEGTQNALEYLYHAKRMVFQSLCQSLVLRHKMAEEARKDGDPDIIRRDFTVKVDNLPTERDWQKIYARAERALAQKEITMADMIKIERARTLAEAQMVFVVRDRENQQRQAEAAKANQDANYQAQMAAPKVAEEAKQSTLIVQHKLESEREELKYQKQSALQRERYMYELELEDKRLASKEGTSFMNNLTKAGIEERKSQIQESKVVAD